MNLLVTIIAALLAIAGLPLARRLWAGPIGSGLAALAARGVLLELSGRQTALASVAEILTRPPDDPAAALASTGCSVDGLEEALRAALGEATAEVWLGLAGQADDEAERVRLVHEAALRGAAGRYSPANDPQPLVQAELAVAKTEAGGPGAAAYRLLDRHGQHLPLVSRLLLQERLALAAGDRELAQRTREQALRPAVADKPPACLTAAWRACLSPWLNRVPEEPPNVRAWREHPPLPAAGGHEAGPRFSDHLEPMRTMLLSLDQLPSDEPRQVLTNVASVLRLVGLSRPESESDWQALYATVDLLGSAPVRYAALAAVCRHARETAEQPRSADDYRLHMHLARGILEAELRARALLQAAAAYGVLPDLTPLVHHELADQALSETNPEFWRTLLDEGAPWLVLVPQRHPAKAALLAAYLDLRWRGIEPAGRPERSGGVVRLEGLLRELVAAPRAPAAWALRGVPATELALLDMAVLALAQDLERRGVERIAARYAESTQRQLRNWARL